MSMFAFVIVLFAALLHATWNAVVKGGNNTLFTTTMITTAGMIIAAAVLPFCAMPAMISFAYIGVSVVLQVIYFLFVGYIYQRCDMSMAYPLMRGSAPFITAMIGLVLLEEQLSAGAWLGVLCICGGIISMVLIKNTVSWHTNWPVFANAVVIAGYTIVDGIGVRLSGAPVAYVLWIMLFQGVILTGMQCFRQKALFVSYVKKYWYFGIIGGFGMMGSYGLALWAMTTAPIVLVAALRETSILFALLISGVILKEHISKMQCIGALCIFLGVVLIKI